MQEVSQPQWALTFQFIWGIIGAAVVGGMAEIGRRYLKRLEKREERARADMLASAERQRKDHEADLARQATQYGAQIAAEREQHEREIERLSAAFEAHYLTLRDIPIRQDKIVQEAVEMAQRLAAAVPVASGAPQREPRRRATP